MSGPTRGGSAASDATRGAAADAGAAGARTSGAAAILERLGVSGREFAGLAAIVLLGAILRLANLPLRGGWDSDQGTEMLGLRAALASGRLPAFGPQAISVASSFHHGALYYDLLLPAAWLGNGDPTWVVAEIALLSLIVIPISWWIARSIGGSAAGLTAALLAATSASLISYATFIWNPTLVEPGAAIAVLGAWQAVRTRHPAWWAVSGIGAAVAVQAHIAAGVILLPLAVTFLIDLRRGATAGRSGATAGRSEATAGRSGAAAGRSGAAAGRRRIAAWGLAGVLLFAATYLPLILSELGGNLADTRGMLAYFSDPNSTSSAAPPLRVLFAAIRILAWPLTRWPIVDFKPAFSLAFLAASALIIGFVWRLGVTAGPRPVAAVPVATSEPAREAPASAPPAREALAPDTDDRAWVERFGTRLVGLWLLLIVLALGLGLHAVSEVQGLPTEQYHVAADPLVFIAAGLILGGMWRPLPRNWATVARRLAAVGTIGILMAWNAGHWPPLTSPDGGWPAAQAAATRVERDAGGASIALVPLFEAKGGDAYLYPLTRDGFSQAETGKAAIVVVLCDTYWLDGCGGTAEAEWLESSAAAAGLAQIDRFAAAPDRILTVYRRGP